MLIFLDTEFTSLPPPISESYRPRPRLISIALVADGAREFYAELTDGWSTNECSDFVRREVLPWLGKARNAPCTRSELAPRLQEWFRLIPRPTTLVYDYFLDWDLLANAFRSDDPDKPLPNVDNKLLLGREVINDPAYQHALNRTFTHDWPPHHALADARAIMAGYKAWCER